MPKRKHGPDKEKRQLTIRLDEALLEQFETQQEETNRPTRITDALEEGLILWMKQHDQGLSLQSIQVRFVVANANKEQQRWIRKFVVFLVLSQIREPTEMDRVLGPVFKQHLDSLEGHFARAAEIFATQAEKLGVQAGRAQRQKESSAPVQRLPLKRGKRVKLRRRRLTAQAMEEKLLPLLKSSTGATIAEIAEVSGWIKGTIDSWLTRMRKRYVIERSGEELGNKRYRIVEGGKYEQAERG